jgi:hypothetical protein
MSKFVCPNCGGTSFEVLESTPRHREIVVEVDQNGQPVEGWIEDASDELDYELSSFVAFACADCSAQAETLDQLVQKVA